MVDSQSLYLWGLELPARSRVVDSPQSRPGSVQSAHATMSYSTLSGSELAAACAMTDELAAWEEFVRRFQPLISRVAANTVCKWGGPSVQLVDDIIQETYLRLCSDRCRLLRNFRERRPDAIFGFIKAVAASVAHDHMKALYAAKRGGSAN